MESKLAFVVIALTFSPLINGCGVTPAGRERTLNFTVTNFKLPAKMAFAENAMERNNAPTISASQSEAETFVEEVLYEQGRSAFIPDQVISLILQQLSVQISYEPLKCINVIGKSLTGKNGIQTMVNCVIIDDTLTNLCMGMNPGDCENKLMVEMNLKPIESKYLSISGSLKTSNGIMANWSNQMWQSVLNRVLRRIVAGQYGSFFYGASVNL